MELGEAVRSPDGKKTKSVTGDWRSRVPAAGNPINWTAA